MFWRNVFKVYTIFAGTGWCGGVLHHRFCYWSLPYLQMAFFENDFWNLPRFGQIWKIIRRLLLPKCLLNLYFSPFRIIFLNWKNKIYKFLFLFSFRRSNFFGRSSEKRFRRNLRPGRRWTRRKDGQSFHFDSFFYFSSDFLVNRLFLYSGQTIFTFYFIKFIEQIAAQSRVVKKFTRDHDC